jgi:hypothetical protein
VKEEPNEQTIEDTRVKENAEDEKEVKIEEKEATIEEVEMKEEKLEEPEGGEES